jgi:glycosyltransferase involved in cell wall biosynthesis
MLANKGIKIAVCIPCFNEEKTIVHVIDSFQSILPNADIYVYDNLSTDKTATVAIKAGAIVRTEAQKGKGNVVRRMFADIDADVYIMIDGDNTYDASIANEMVDLLISNNLDIVVATRNAHNPENAYRGGHIFGNWALTKTVSSIFQNGFTDMLSGYRVMSRRFVKSFPISSKGFEIETEMNIHALQMSVPFDEIQSSYASRPIGSESKLSTWIDGIKILFTIFILFKELKPFLFYGFISLFFASISIILALPILHTWIDSGLVPRFPTAILSTGIMILAFLNLSAGLILDSLSRARLDEKRMKYLSYPSMLELLKKNNESK